MHADVHHMLHAERSAELRRQAARHRLVLEHRRAWKCRQTAHLTEVTATRVGVRARLGWRLIEWGLRLVSRPTPRKARLA
jgi:hypothetical protein